MTIEQAIKILKADETDDSFDWGELGLKGTEDFNRAWDEAYNMAIQALEQEPCEDCISREKAIKEFQVYREYSSNRTNNEWVDRIEKVLECLPPVIPKGVTITDFADKCRECGKNTISREKIKEALEKMERGLQSCFNTVHCESNNDLLEGQEKAFEYCIETLKEALDADSY